MNPNTTMSSRVNPLRLLGVAATSAVLVLAACSTPGSGGGGETPGAVEDDEQYTTPVTPEQVAELGDVTLRVWADQGEESLMQLIIPQYEDEYPNVAVEIQYMSFNDLTATVVNALNSEDPPDVAQGNQGWATDGALVRAGLLRPLDDIADAYGYRAAAGEAISQLQWSPDGESFGEGTLYGMSPDNQMVGIFYNKEKLDALGLQPPGTFEELEAALEAAHTAGETPLMLGNSDRATAMQAFSLIQGAMTPAQDTVDWITGSGDASFDQPGNIQALETWAGWVQEGYVSDGYDARSPDDAATAFAAGEGVFLIAGSWQAGTVSDGSQFGFIAAPASEANESASSGSFGMNWHVASRSELVPAAVAFVGMINDPDNADLLVEVNRVPIAADGLASEDLMFTDLLTASERQLSTGGSLYWYDWATNTMFDTFTTNLQELMNGRIDAQQLVDAVQQDWDEFQADR